MADDPARETDRDTAGDIAEEHRELRRTLARIEGTGEPMHLLALLEELHRQLEVHFAEEEGEDGLVKAIDTSNAQSVRCLERLFEEHRGFVVRIDDIATRLRDLKAEMSSVNLELHRLCGDLRAHEAQENTLLTEAVFTDVGTGD